MRDSVKEAREAHNLKVLFESGLRNQFHLKVAHPQFERHKLMQNFLEFLQETSQAQKAIKAFKGQTPYVKTMAIMSPENPMGRQLSPSENKGLCDKFESELRRGHFAFKRVKGRYNQVEHSYIIFNVKLKDVLRWCSTEQFNQESFFYCVSKYDEKRRMAGMYYTYYEKPSHGVHRPIETTDIWNSALDYTDYYTQISRKFKFSIPLKIFESCVESYENYLIEMSENWDVVEFGTLNDNILRCVDESQFSGYNDYVRRGRINKHYKFEE